jgi:hypothetical protein
MSRNESSTSRTGTSEASLNPLAASFTVNGCSRGLAASLESVADDIDELIAELTAWTDAHITTVRLGSDSSLVIVGKESDPADTTLGIAGGVTFAVVDGLLSEIRVFRTDLSHDATVDRAVGAATLSPILDVSQSPREQ